jgi:hypothetical protein
MSGGLLKALRSDSYVELSQYRDQHFRVRKAGLREGAGPGQNAEKRFAHVSLCRLPFCWCRNHKVGSRCLLGRQGTDPGRVFGYYSSHFRRKFGTRLSILLLPLPVSSGSGSGDSSFHGL